MNMLCLMLLTLRHIYSGGAKPKTLDISYWLVPSSRDSDVHLGQCFLVFPAVWFGRAALSWDHWNQNSELEQYYQKPQGSHWHIPKSRETDKTSSSFPPEIYNISLSQSSEEWGDGGGSKAGLGNKLIVGHCICKEPAFRVPRKKASLVPNFVWIYIIWEHF